MVLPTGVDQNNENNGLVCPTAQSGTVDNIAQFSGLPNLGGNAYSAPEYVASVRASGATIQVTPPNEHFPRGLYVGMIDIADADLLQSAFAKLKLSNVTDAADYLEAEGGAK